MQKLLNFRLATSVMAALNFQIPKLAEVSGPWRGRKAGVRAEERFMFFS